MNRRAKVDAASFTLGGEIRNRTNKKTTNKQTVSTPYLSACVDNEYGLSSLATLLVFMQLFVGHMRNVIFWYVTNMQLWQAISRTLLLFSKCAIRCCSPYL